ncbi:MAG TPA: ATP-binding protein [Bacteroidales bacterium]|jgi:hypothetical protein|nr:ATP-binding protein [Bacteroidales bacterium]
MKDISYHILDIVQNSLNAGASSVLIELNEKSCDGILQLIISDDGKGMNREELDRATDPFYTSSVTKKVGLGLPLLKQNAEQTGGSFRIISAQNKGTMVNATFMTDHIDMLPLGDMALTMRLLIASNPDISFTYRHMKNEEGFELNTSELRTELGEIKMNRKDVLDFISDYIYNCLNTTSV